MVKKKTVESFKCDEDLPKSYRIEIYSLIKIIKKIVILYNIHTYKRYAIYKSWTDSTDQIQVAVVKLNQAG